MSFFNRCTLAGGLVTLLGLNSGCTSRGMTVTSNPPGAELSINRRVVGTTPMRVSFDHYGTYRLELRKKGYDVLVKEEDVKPGLYGYDPAAFVADNMVPLRLNDEAYFHYNMASVEGKEPRTALMERANSARNGEAVNPRTGEKVVVDLGQDVKALISVAHEDEVAKEPQPPVDIVDSETGRTIRAEKPKGLEIAKEYGIATEETESDFQKPTAKKSNTPAKEVRIPKDEEVLYDQPELKDSTATPKTNAPASTETSTVKNDSKEIKAAKKDEKKNNKKSDKKEK